MTRLSGRSLAGGIVIAACALASLSPAVAADRLAPVEPGATRVGGEIGGRITATIEGNLLKLDVDRDFLTPFRKRDRRGGFVGLGMFIDSLVHMAKHTGDERVLALKNRTVAEAIAAQQPDGYLGIMPEESRIWRLWDPHESAYLIHGLTSDFLLFGERRSLDAAARIADRLIDGMRRHPGRDMGDATVSNDTATGLDWALLRLAECTGKAAYRDFVVTDRKLPAWNLPIVTGRWGKIDGHAYAFIDHAMSQAFLERIDSAVAARHGGLRRQLDTAVAFLLAKEGMVITGGCGDHECWHDTQQGTVNLGETCATGCMIRLMDDCLRRDGLGRFGDVMERSIHNALFAAQSPDGRRLRYYTPFDGPRAYYRVDTYCCPCNYRRIVAELPGFVYYRGADGGVAVNLYTESRTSIDVGGVTVAIRQETDYPASGRVVVAVDPAQPVELVLRLRIPRWCAGATVRVNDGPPEPSPRGDDGFHAIARRWQAGDRVVLDLPMEWRLVKGRRGQAGRVAVMRGPRVFCLARSGIAPLGGDADAGAPAGAAAAAEVAIDPRLLTIKPDSIKGPLPDDATRPKGVACTIEAWRPGAWYPHARPDLRLTLTEFPDPAGEATYFNVPNPSAAELVDDELMSDALLPRSP
jgi:hypothetical protein